MNTKRLLLLLMVLILVLAACNGDDEEEGGDNADTHDPVALVNSAAQEIDNANSFQLSLKVEGNTIVLDVGALQEGATLSFTQATADFVKPESIQANVEVSFQDVPTEVQLRAIGTEQFVKHQVLTLNQWMQETLVEGFNPASLVSAESGIATALRSLQNAEYVGEGEVDGIAVHQLRGQLDAPLVQSVTVGLIGTQDGVVEAELFIRQDNGRLEKLVLKEPLLEGQTSPTTWTIGLYNYDGDFSVERPDVN